MLKPLLNLLPPLFINQRLGILPNADEILHFTDTTVITVCHFLKDSLAALQTVTPRHTVEPQQITLRTSVDIVIHATVRLTIQCRSIRTRMRTVKTDTIFIRLVIICRTPLQRHIGIKPVRLWSIVLIKGYGADR